MPQTAHSSWFYMSSPSPAWGVWYLKDSYIAVKMGLVLLYDPSGLGRTLTPSLHPSSLLLAFLGHQALSKPQGSRSPGGCSLLSPRPRLEACVWQQSQVASPRALQPQQLTQGVGRRLREPDPCVPHAVGHAERWGWGTDPLSACIPRPLESEWACPAEACILGAHPSPHGALHPRNQPGCSRPEPVDL